MPIIPREQMPEDREDLKTFEVQFAPLGEAESARHPEFMKELMQYLDMEADVFDPADVTFLRSAQVEEKKFWLWEFYDPMGTHCYAAVSENPKGGRAFSYDECLGLTPDQFLLAEYHGCY